MLNSCHFLKNLSLSSIKCSHATKREAVKQHIKLVETPSAKIKVAYSYTLNIVLSLLVVQEAFDVLMV